MKEIYLIFDKEELFEQEIQPVLDHLKSLLLHYDLPFFFAVAVKSEENETKYIYESHDVWSTSRHMKDGVHGRRFIPAYVGCGQGEQEKSATGADE